MTPEELAHWRHNPVTIRYFKFLRDQREAIGFAMGEYIANGTAVNVEKANEAALRCEIMKDLENLTIEDFENFYGKESESDE